MKKEKKDRAPPRTVRHERVVGDTRAATRDTRRDKNALMLLPSSKTSSDAPAAVFAVVRLERYPRSARGAASFGCRRADDAAPRAGPWRRARGRRSTQPPRRARRRRASSASLVRGGANLRPPPTRRRERASGGPQLRFRGKREHTIYGASENLRREKKQSIISDNLVGGKRKLRSECLSLFLRNSRPCPRSILASQVI